MRGALALALLIAAGCGAASVVTADVVVASDRSAEDRALDPGRKPTEFLAFIGVIPGMRAAEIGAGGGYTAELLARAVGEAGTVYAQNSQAILSFAGEAWAARLAKPVMKNVVRVDRELDAPLPPEAKDLDVVVLAFLYHDLVWMGTDRPALNRAVFAALKPGGVFVVADHSAKAGAGLNDVKTFHRIEEKTVIDEVEAAGFKLVATGEFLRNRLDGRDWNDSPRAAGAQRGTSDRFVLKFIRP